MTPQSCPPPPGWSADRGSGCRGVSNPLPEHLLAQEGSFDGPTLRTFGQKNPYLYNSFEMHPEGKDGMGALTCCNSFRKLRKQTLAQAQSHSKTSNGQPLSFPAASNHSVELRQVNAGAEHQSNHTWKADTYKLGSTEQPTLAHPTGEGRAESKAGSRRR